MMEKKIHPLGFVALLFGLIILPGCEQSENVTIHKPGVYQGASDNLMTDAAALQERIKNQMDR